ncbi:hypothetical protein ACFL2R_01265 [Patescibacteria group bacterium]
MVVFTNTGLIKAHYLAYETACRLFDQKIARILDREIEDFWDIIEDCIVAHVAGTVSERYHYSGKEDLDLSNWLFAEKIVQDGGNQPCMAGIFISTYLLGCIYNNVSRFITGSRELEMEGGRDLLYSHEVISKISQVDERVLSIYLHDLFDESQDDIRRIFNEIMGSVCEKFFAEKIKKNLPGYYQEL